eukprot:m.7535 g.7535  ORF g.7535 m.7535 type:complete len:52 (-) comp2826_c0_seq1:260-415(-)
MLSLFDGGVLFSVLTFYAGVELPYYFCIVVIVGLSFWYFIFSCCFVACVCT